MIAYSLGGLLLSLLPFSLAYVGLSEQSLWAISSAAMAIIVSLHWGFATFLILRAVGGTSSMRDPVPTMNPTMARAIGFFTLAAVIVQILNAAGVGYHRNFTAYYLGLLWYVAASGLFFARLVAASGLSRRNM